MQKEMASAIPVDGLPREQKMKLYKVTLLLGLLSLLILEQCNALWRSQRVRVDKDDAS